VVVTAPTNHRHAGEATTVHLCEFKRGNLFRAVHLPHPVNPAGARAEYTNGLLRLTLPLAIPVTQRVAVGEAAALPERADVEC
jgi:HSP20 family molecular chaperone IbpA